MQYGKLITYAEALKMFNGQKILLNSILRTFYIKPALAGMYDQEKLKRVKSHKRYMNLVLNIVIMSFMIVNQVFIVIKSIL